MKNKKVLGSILVMMLSVSMAVSAGAADFGTALFTDGSVEGSTVEATTTPTATPAATPGATVTPTPAATATPSITPSLTGTPEPTVTPAVEEPEDPSQPVHFGDFLFYFLDEERASLASYEGDDKEVVIPEEVAGRKVVSIETFAFRENKAIEKVVIPTGVQTIGQDAFNMCGQLVEVVIPDNVTRIGESAFANCISLKSLSLSKNIKSIERGAFANCPELVLNLDKENPYYNIEDGLLYTEDLTTLVACIGNKKEYVIPETVKKIGAWAFSGTEPESIRFLNQECVFEDNAPGIPVHCETVIYGYAGTDAEKFAIEKNLKFVSLSTADISKADITIEEETRAYTGEEIAVPVTVKYGESILREDVDYTVSYKNNKELGTATVIVEGKGNYTGKVTAGTFKITLATPILTGAVSTGYHSAKISWDAVPGAKSYILYYKGGTVKKWTRVKTGLTETSYEQTSTTKLPLAVGTTYTYTVKAVNGKTVSGCETDGIKVKIIPAMVQLGKVTSAAYNKQKITWSKVDGVTGYVVYQKINDKWKKVGATKTTSYINTHSSEHPVLTGVTNTYNVRAYCKVGSKYIYSEYPERGISGKSLLSKPAISKITKTTSGLKVQWGKISGANGYVVKRYSAAEGKWMTIRTIKSGSATSYTDTTAKKGTTYKYRIAAYSTASGKAFYSSYSTAKAGKR